MKIFDCLITFNIVCGTLTFFPSYTVQCTRQAGNPTPTPTTCWKPVQLLINTIFSHIQ